MELILIYCVMVNAITFLMYGMDKWRARKGKRRISERCLLGLAAIGGSVGAYVSMYFFRHKTKKPKFYLGVPILFLLQAGIILYAYYYR